MSTWIEGLEFTMNLYCEDTSYDDGWTHLEELLLERDYDMASIEFNNGSVRVELCFNYEEYVDIDKIAEYFANASKELGAEARL